MDRFMHARTRAQTFVRVRMRVRLCTHTERDLVVRKHEELLPTLCQVLDVLRDHLAHAARHAIHACLGIDPMPHGIDNKSRM